MPSDSTTPRLCRVCQTDISDRHLNAKFCEPCSAQHTRAQKRETERLRQLGPCLSRKDSSRLTGAKPLAAA